jgi:hypothetical protein
MEWRVIETKLFTERNIKTERKESKELGKDLEKYTRNRDFGGLRSQAELRNMTQTHKVDMQGLDNYARPKWNALRSGMAMAS